MGFADLVGYCSINIEHGKIHADQKIELNIFISCSTMRIMVEWGYDFIDIYWFNGEPGEPYVKTTDEP